MAQSKGRNVKKRSTSVDTSPGQVDTRDRSQRNMLTGFHLRSTLNQIGYKYPPIGYPTCKNPFRASQKSCWRLEGFSSLFLPSWCFLKPNSHMLKCEKWRLTLKKQLDHLKEADQVEADFCEEFKEDPEDQNCRASPWNF
ncbi:hypothetical protein Taro_055777, partial [Colocasia esculenta]|nr:hypothetical protein [Colocasia esculenta]